jgi:predicted dehydrogenase
MSIIVVGGGKMGLSHLAIISRIIGHNLVSICDSSWSTRFIFKKFKFQAFSSLDDAFNSEIPISGVVVATPTSYHYEVAKSAILRSIPCFIEKPLTLDVCKSRELAALAGQNNVYTQMGFVLRFVASFNRLHSLVETGVLGKVCSYVARMSGNVITKPDNKGWRTNFAAGGGCLNEYGPHLIDLCRFVFGEISELYSATKGHVYSNKADDMIYFTWAHSSGCLGEVFLNWCDKSKRKSVIEFEVEFEHARVTANNSALKIAFKDSAPLTPEQMHEISMPDVPPRVSFYLRGEEFSLQLETFAENCLHRKFRADDKFGIGSQALIKDGVAVDILIDSIATKVELQ